SVLPRAGLGDDPLLAHAQGQQRLADRVVELVRAGVAQVLALEVDVRAAEVLAQPRRGVERSRPADERAAMSGQLELELRVGLGLVPHVLELAQRAHQRLRHVLAAEGAEAPVDRVSQRRARHLAPCLRTTHGLHELVDLVWVLDPHPRLDPAGDVHPIWPELAHETAHVTRLETACDEHAARFQQLARRLPVPGPAGAAALVRRPGVEHDRAGPVRGPPYVAVADLEHLHRRPAGVEAGRLGAVELEQVEVDVVRDLAHLLRRLVDEDTYDRGPHRHLVHDRLRVLGRDPAVGVAEVEADHVRACVRGQAGALEVADPADLDSNHARYTPRTLARSRGPLNCARPAIRITPPAHGSGPQGRSIASAALRPGWRPPPPRAS